ncbi:putative Ig domain-containing protein [Leifsonia sp. NPDC058194]|uniref:putative Ig domain-containing protein n=1 Tax=Leifsonia sp. NPDC058194 TaxID=3346374 RepID=UPI0036DDB30E
MPVPTRTTTPTPVPTDSSTPGAGATAGPTPEPSSTPSPSPTPGFGGTAADQPQPLAQAIQGYGYSTLMHVTGNFDLTGAVWGIAQGSLPAGLSIDPAVGTIAGTTTDAVANYQFQLQVTGHSGAVTGWFSIDVVAPTSGTTDPAPGTNTPTPTPGGGGATPEPTQTVGAPGTGTDPTQPGGSSTPFPTDTATPAPSDPTPTPTPSGGSTQPPSTGGTGGTGRTDPTTSTPVPTSTPDPGSTSTPTPGGSTPTPTGPLQIDPGTGGSQPDVLTFTPPAGVAVTVGAQIDQTMTATSSLGLAITYSASGLPSWLTYTDGRLFGTAPTVEGSFNATLTAADAKNTVTRQLTVTVNPDAIQASAGTLSLTQGQSGSLDLSASDGASNASFTYSVTQAAGGTASISGSTLTATYSQPGSYSITVGVQDTSAPGGDSITLSIPVDVAPLPIALTAGSQNATQYVAFKGTLTATGGWGQYAYTVVAGTLPTGITLGTDGTLSGTPAATGSTTATVQVTDAKGLTAQSSLTFTVATNPAISPTATITVGNGTIDEALSADGSKLFVPANLSQNLSVVDASSNAVLSTLKLTVVPKSISTSPDGKYIAIGSGSAVQILDASSYALVTSIPGTNILNALWSQDSSQLYVLRSTAIGAAVDVMNVPTWTKARTVTFGGTPYNWVMSMRTNGHLLANSGYSSNLYDIDPVAGTSSVVWTNGASGIAVSVAAPDGTVWTVISASLRHVDATGKVIATVSLPAGTSPSSMALSPDGRWLYALRDGSVNVVDTQLNSVTATVPVDGGNGGKIIVTASGTKVFATAGNSKTTVTVLTPAVK